MHCALILRRLVLSLGPKLGEAECQFLAQSNVENEPRRQYLIFVSLQTAFWRRHRHESMTEGTFRKEHLGDTE